MSFIAQLNELQAAKQKLASAEAKFAADRVNALSKLPAEYGYSSLNDFIKALKDATKGKKIKASAKSGKVKPAKATKISKAEKKAAKQATTQTGKRAKITPELKAKVIAAVNADKSGAEIAKAFGISLPSVQNIKKEAGLVKARTSKVAPAVEAAAGPVDEVVAAV